MPAERVKRLKELVDRLERLPASEDRDRVLSEVRSRAVDLDTGETPRAMLPIREPIPPPRVIAEPAPKPYRPRRLAPPPARPAAPALPAAAASRDEWLSLGALLSLDDSPEPDVQAPGAVPPWTLGLRG